MLANIRTHKYVDVSEQIFEKKAEIKMQINM